MLVDDGSTDGSGDICDRWAERDSRIKVIRRENTGVVAARKAGLQAASGRFIAYVDSDDWIEPLMMEKMICALRRENVDIVTCGRYIDQGKSTTAVNQGIPCGRYNKKEMEEEIYPQMIVNQAFLGLFPNLWDKLFRRECLEQFQMAVDDRVTMGEDAACFYPAMLYVNSIYIMPDCFYHYRQIPSSMVHQAGNSKQECEHFRILYHSVKRQFEEGINIFDFREQWEKYLLFLMVPRADILYEQFGQLDYLFPYPRVKRGSKVVIYCAGVYGQRLYQYLRKTGFCTAVALADRNAAVLREQGVSVILPNEIRQFEFDAIIIANSFANTGREIYRELAQYYPKEKIHMMSESLIFSEDTKKAFGLMEGKI